MTWKEARRRMQSEQQQSTEELNPAMIQLLQQVRNKPFFDWFAKDHKQILNANATIGRKCYCFNCQFGWPTKKNGKKYPLFDYELQVFRALAEPSFINARKATEEDDRWYEEQKKLIEEMTTSKKGNITNTYQKLLKERHARLTHKHKENHLAILKSSGLGLSTFMVRWIAWNCMKDDKWKGTDVVILTGPRQSLSNDLIGMLKSLFLSFGITFDTSVSTLILNGVRIRAFPSDHLSAARGIPSVSMVYCDEASWFSPQSQKEVTDLIERYAGKNQSTIVLTSTPNKVGDLMHTILSTPFEQSFYKVMRLSWHWGLNKVYSDKDIEIAKKSSSFEREFNLSFNSPSGNCFSHSSIDKAVELSKKYPDTINMAASHSLGCDPGFGSSSFALVCLEYSDSIIKVVYAKTFERSSYNDMLQEIWNIRNMVGSLDNVYIDMANTEFVKDVKEDMGDNTDWQYIHETLLKYKKMKSARVEDVMKVVPVSFREDGASMLVHVKNLLDHEDGLIAINPKYIQLITALKGAVSVEYKIVKSESPLNDLTDAFRLACRYFHLEK
jgi:hypothetical protein